MRTYKLKDPLHPDGHLTINVKYDHDCVFCTHCDSILWDYTNLIYGIGCDLGNETNEEHTCKDFEEVDHE